MVGLISFALSALPLVLLSSTCVATGVRPGQIKNLVTFGDSYTDVVATGDAGVAWPIYAADYGHLKLFPFARSGATCSNNLTFRPFPSLYESQLPLYFTEKQNGTLKAAAASDTIYTLWIGTNDVGVNSLLVGQGVPGTSVVDTTTCAVSWVNTLYESGARNFIFQNMIPLQDTILYHNVSYPNRYWTAPRNSTEWSVTMTELTKSGNEISKLMLQALAPTLPGAHIALFDSHALFTDMYANPAKYLNGTAPLNVTSCINHCVFEVNESTSDPGTCTVATGTDRDSFLWYDELHPSEQTDRMVAKEIVQVIQGKTSPWATWFS